MKTMTTKLIRTTVVHSFKSLRFVSSRPFSAQNMLQESKIRVQDYMINYLKVGEGNHFVLCLPGVAGTIWTDFSSQINGINLNKYTLVVWDPPGYGNSRPPPRNFTPDFLSKDADMAAEFMDKLNINKYSILGWSNGGISGLMAASRYQENVHKLVTWGAYTFVTEEDLVRTKFMGDVDSWSPKMREPFERIYGAEYLKQLIKDWYKTLWLICSDYNGDICNDEIKKIKAPTLILHGGKDPVTPYSKVEFIEKNLKNSKVYIFKDGGHNIHIKYAEEFNRVVEKFLEE